MISNHAYKAISELDLTAITSKLMHPKAGEGWSQDKANAIEQEYRRFLYLMKAYPDVQTAPMENVDTFWHYHILDTMKYAADCEHAFGYFVHHFPYLGLRGEDDEVALADAGERMKSLYEDVFGETYGQAVAAWCCKADGTTVNAAWCCKAGEPQIEVKAAWCCKADVPEVKAAWCCTAADTLSQPVVPKKAPLDALARA